MPDLRHAGYHWPNGAADNAKSLALPSPVVLMLSPEARWWYDSARKLGKRVVWRDVPAPGSRPAEIGWSARRAADAAMVLWNEQPHYGAEEFQSHCELNLNYERGDQRDDQRDLDSRMATLVQFLGALEPELRRRLPSGTRLHFPPWVPDGRAYDRVEAWRGVANQYDIINTHFYGPPEDTVQWLQQHLDWFPDKEVFLSEWWNDDYRGTLQALAELAAREPRFSGATVFAGRWYNAPGWWPSWRNVQDNDELYALFMSPPVVEDEPHTDPAPEEAPAVPSTPEFPLPVDDNGQEWKADYHTVLQAILEVAPAEGIDVRPLLGLCLAESGFDFQSQERWATWTNHGVEAVRQRNLGYASQIMEWGWEAGTNDFSAGVAHQAWAWWDEFPGNPTDPNDPHRWNTLEWLEFRKRFIQDHGYAVRYAARRIRPYLQQRPNDHQWVLERYNKPNGEVSAGVRTNYQRGLAKADEILAALYPSSKPEVPPVAPVPPSASSVVFEDYSDSLPAGTFSQQPMGCILHGSRSGIVGRPVYQEYVGTAGYEQNNAAGLGWNATIGPLRVAVHLSPRQWGWNARAASTRYLAVEIAQPTVDTPVSDEQVEAFCTWWEQHVLPVWPNIPANFPSHAEVERAGETGAYDGKTDVFPVGDARMDELRLRIYTRLNTGAPPVPSVPSEPSTAAPSPEEERKALISAIGYMSGDMARRVEETRARIDDYGNAPDPIAATAVKADLLARLREWEAWGAKVRSNTDDVYAEFGRIKDELERVGRDTL